MQRTVSFWVGFFVSWLLFVELTTSYRPKYKDERGIGSYRKNLANCTWCCYKKHYKFIKRKFSHTISFYKFEHFQTIIQNGGFTKVWVSLKTIYFPIVLGILIWYWRRVHMLTRSPALLEYMLLALGGALTFLNGAVFCLTYK